MSLHTLYGVPLRALHHASHAAAAAAAAAFPARRRKRLATAGRVDVGDDDLEEDDDLFAPFRRQAAQQEAALAKARLRSVDPTVNLAAASADASPAASAAGQAAAGAEPGGGRRRRDGIARDLNRHAAAVLEGAPEGLAGVDPGEGGTAGIAARVAAAVAAAAQRRAAAPAAGGGADDVSQETLEGWRRRAAAALEDLTLGDRPPAVPLDIQDPRAYFSSTGGAPPPAWPGGAGAAARAAAAAARGVDASALACPPCDPGLAGAALLGVLRDEDAAAVAEFGPVAAAALGTHPKDALGSVMVVSRACGCRVGRGFDVEAFGCAVCQRQCTREGGAWSGRSGRAPRWCSVVRFTRAPLFFLPRGCRSFSGPRR
jgi:hypothetical protein